MSVTAIWFVPRFCEANFSSAPSTARSTTPCRRGGCGISRVGFLVLGVVSVCAEMVCTRARDSRDSATRGARSLSANCANCGNGHPNTATPRAVAPPVASADNRALESKARPLPSVPSISVIRVIRGFIAFLRLRGLPPVEPGHDHPEHDKAQHAQADPAGPARDFGVLCQQTDGHGLARSEEHTSELQSPRHL